MRLRAKAPSTSLAHPTLSSKCSRATRTPESGTALTPVVISRLLMPVTGASCLSRRCSRFRHIHSQEFRRPSSHSLARDSRTWAL